MMKESFPIPSSEETPENPSRRKFLKTLGTGAALAAAGPFLADRGEKLYGETLGKERLENELSALRERLRQERGIEVDFSSAFPTETAELGLKGGSVEYLTEKRDICEALLEVLDLYPPFLHKNAGVSVVRVMNSIKLEENGKREDVAGLAERVSDTIHVEFVEKHPDGPDGQLLAVINEVFPSRDGQTEQFQHILHHELEHFTEHEKKVDRDAYMETTRGFLYDGRPLPRDFLYCSYDTEMEYLVQKEHITKELFEKLRENYYGFARRYGKKSPSEDRATIAEELFGSHENRTKLLERTKTDSVLLRKVEFMKNHYFSKSLGLMDKMYWELLEKPESDHKMMAEYLKLHAGIIGQMDDETFAAHIRKTLDTEVSFDAKAWRAEVLSYAEAPR